MQYDQNDIDLFCLCVWRESRGEGFDGMDAVAHVIVNRVGFPGFAHTLHDVIMGKNQFTSMSPTDPEYKIHPQIGDVQNGYLHHMIPLLLQAPGDDPTLGAHYYADLRDTTSGWFFEHIVQDTVNHPHTVKIGHHDFYV